MSSDKVFYAVVGFFTVLLFAGIVFFATKNNPSTPSTSEPITYDAKELIGENPHVYGDLATAPVVLVEFSDFQCPACKNFATTFISRVKELYPNDVAIVYRNLPLTTIHKYSFNAAVAAEAAAKQDKFWEYHDALFENQGTNDDQLKEEDFVKIAGDLGLDTEKFKSDYNSSNVESLARDDLNYALSLNLNSTPTIFINGVKIDLQHTDPFTYIEKIVSSSTPKTPKAKTE